MCIHTLYGRKMQEKLATLANAAISNGHYYPKAVLTTVRKLRVIWAEQLNSLTALSMTNCTHRNFISRNVGVVADE